jgi:hypothetical protein
MLNPDMTNPDPEQDLEALIRAAGDYVRPSEDLRPRVLEEARVSRTERRAQGWIWQAALAVVVCVMFVSHWRLQLARDAETPDPAPTVGQPDSPGWHAVDRFSSIRRRQATLLRWDFLLPDDHGQ